MKVAFFSLEGWEKEYIENDAHINGGAVELAFFNEPLTEDNIPEGLDAEVISVFINSTITDKVLEKLPKLKLIATRSTGFDHIDISACKARGIKVATVPFYGERTVAEFTFALILSLSRKICGGYDRIKKDCSFSLEGLQGFDLAGKTLGVIGTGNIGRNVIRIAKGFEMNIFAHDIKKDGAFAREMNFSYTTFDELLEKSDIATLHVPYIKQTYHLINADTIAKMKKGAYLINTSRGAVVDTEALVKNLKNGHLGGAGLDVLEEEGAIRDELDLLVGGHPQEETLRTVLANHILMSMPNVLITPHNAFNTKEALQRILSTTTENINLFFAGTSQNLVK